LKRWHRGSRFEPKITLIWILRGSGPPCIGFSPHKKERKKENKKEEVQWLKGGPEALENKMNEILGSMHDLTQPAPVPSVLILYL